MAVSTVQIEFGRDSVINVSNGLHVCRGTEIRFYAISGDVISIKGFRGAAFTNSSMITPSWGRTMKKYIHGTAINGVYPLTFMNETTGKNYVFNIKVVDPFTDIQPYHLSAPNPTAYTNLRTNERVVTERLRAITSSWRQIYIRSPDPEVRFRYIDAVGRDEFISGWTPVLFLDSTYYREFEISMRASGLSHTSKTVVVYVGNRTVTFTLTTGEEVVPSNHKAVTRTYSGDVPLSGVREFFGGGTNIKDYYRGGRNVPDMPANSAIPISGDINLSNFRTMATALFISKQPESEKVAVYNAHRDQSTQKVWSIWSGEVDNWDLGYSKFIKDNAEFRYTMSWRIGGGWPNQRPTIEPYLTSSGGNAGTWSSNNRGITLMVYAMRGEEFYMTCTVNFYARHKDFPNDVLSTSATYEVRAFGI